MHINLFSTVVKAINNASPSNSTVLSYLELGSHKPLSKVCLYPVAPAYTNISRSFGPWSRDNLTFATPTGSFACNSLFPTSQAVSSHQTAASIGLGHPNDIATASAITTYTQTFPTPPAISPPIRNGGHRLPIGWASTLFLNSWPIIYYYARLLLILFLLLLIFF